MINSKCLLLTKVQLRSEFSRNLKTKGGIYKTVILALLGGMVLYFAYYLSNLIGSAGLPEVIPSIGIVITSLFVLFYTILKTNGVLFAYKEYDTLMSFPIKTSVVISSRFLTMYVMNLVFVAFVMLPMGVGYAQWVHPDALFYMEWVLGIVAIPLFPTTFAALLGMLVILVSSQFKKSSAAVIVLFPLVLLALVGIPFLTGRTGYSGVNATQLKSVSEFVLRLINHMYLPASLFYGGIVQQQLSKMLAFLLGSLVCYYIFVKFVAIMYKRLNTALTTHYAQTDYKLPEIKCNSQLAALYKKEVRKFFSSPMYCLNMGLGTVFVAAIAVGSFFVGNQTMSLLLQPFGANGDLTRTSPLVIGALVSITCTTSVSLSLEGKNLWIIKTFPLRAVTVYKSKALFNLTLQIPSVLLAAICLNIRFPMLLASRILLLIVPLTFALFSTILGMFLNLKMPNYEWVSEVALIRRGAPTVLGVVGALLIGGGMSYLSTQFQQVASDLYMSAITLLFVIGSCCLWCYIKKQRI